MVRILAGAALQSVSASDWAGGEEWQADLSLSSIVWAREWYLDRSISYFQMNLMQNISYFSQAGKKEALQFHSKPQPENE